MCVFFFNSIARSSPLMSSCTALLEAKLLLYFGQNEDRIKALLSLEPLVSQVFELIAYFVCQYCARNSVHVGGYAVFAQYRQMAILYTKSNFCILPGPDATTTSTTTINGMPMAQAHFLSWFVRHRLDLYVIEHHTLLRQSMATYKRQTARKYRQRQRAKKRKCAQAPRDLALGKTAAQDARARLLVETISRK